MSKLFCCTVSCSWTTFIGSIKITNREIEAYVVVLFKSENQVGCLTIIKMSTVYVILHGLLKYLNE